MNLDKLYLAAPGGCYKVNHLPELEEGEIVSFIGIYVGEFNGYYRFVSDKQIHHVMKVAPVDFFNFSVPENYKEIMQDELPWYFEELVSFSVQDKDYIQAFADSLLYQCSYSIEEDTEKTQEYKYALSLLKTAKNIYE